MTQKRPHQTPTPKTLYAIIFSSEISADASPSIFIHVSGRFIRPTSLTCKTGIFHVFTLDYLDTSITKIDKLFCLIALFWLFEVVSEDYMCDGVAIGVWNIFECQCTLSLRNMYFIMKYEKRVSILMAFVLDV